MNARIRSEILENRRGRFLINSRVIELDVVPLRTLLSSVLIYGAHFDFGRDGTMYEGFHPGFQSLSMSSSAPEYIPVLRDDGVLEFIGPIATGDIPNSWQVLSSSHWCIDQRTGWGMR